MPKDKKYRVVQGWNDNLAEVEYRLEVNCGGFEPWVDTGFSGDAEWAFRQARHYSCLVFSEQLTVISTEYLNRESAE